MAMPTTVTKTCFRYIGHTITSNSSLRMSIAVSDVIRKRGLCTTATESMASTTTTSSTTSLQRGDYSHVSQEDLSCFYNILDKGRVITDPHELAFHNTDWLNKYKGNSAVVLKPKTTAEVSAIMSHCYSRHIAVVPQGGNTGLVGGGVPVHDEVILSTSLMNNIISFDEVSGSLVCQSGCILENLNSYLTARDYIMPLDLGAKGSCQIGGNISTNAGGIRLIRYGSLHGSVLGLEVVLADGTVLDNLSTLRKDNTGYDLKQLFIGAEGTLGIVTGVSILAPPRSKSVQVAFLGCRDFESVCTTFRHAKRNLSEILSACEFLDDESLRLVTTHLAGTANPLGAERFPFYVLIETSGSNERHDSEKLEHFLESSLESGYIESGMFTAEPSKVHNVWEVRERIAESTLRDGAVYKYDVSLPLSDLYKLVEVCRERLNDRVRSVVGYGHLGDGNLHLNITGDSFHEELTNLIEPFVYEWTASHSGSISAEHGLGFMKPRHIHYSKSLKMVNAMRQVKHLFDPTGIMNPLKTIPMIPST